MYFVRLFAIQCKCVAGAPLFISTEDKLSMKSETVEYKQVSNLTVKCGKCGTYSEIPRTHHTH